MTSLFDYNSPLWLRNINQQNPIGETLFGESLTYTEGGFHTDGTDAKYFDGTIASATSSGTNDQSFRYSYNSVGAVENAESMPETNWSLGVTQNVAYDPNGNFQSLFRGGIQKTYNYFDGTQRVKDVVNADGSTAASYEYDPNGNTTLANSAATGLSAAHNLHFTYDAGTKMASRVTDTVAGGSTLNLWYGHDNDRVQKDILNGTSLVAQKLYIRGLNSHPICELTSQDGVITPVIYIYGPNGLLAMRRAEDTFGILKDHLGSTRAVVDSSATVIAQYNYLTFGALGTIQEPFSGFMPYLFTGQEFDHEIGLYNYRARFYSAELGRFLAVDPVAQFFSPYIYASNNPVLFVDPTGGISTWARVLFGVAMAVVGVAVIGLTIATGGATAPAVAAWAAGLGASASVAAGVGAVAAVTASAALGAASGAALSSSMYALSTSNEDFSWGRLGQNAALGAIAGAVTGGVAQGISLGGQAVATAVTGVSEAGAKWAAGVTSKALISYAARSAAIGGIASGIGGAAGSGVSGAVSNVWGLTDYGPGEMAVSILTGLGTGAAKGAAGGIAGAAAAKVKAPLTNKWNSLSAKTQTRVKVGGAVAGVVAVGGTYGYLYDREATREAALA
jgi:RHS repeat-associated protein